jgi:hypothetical protein
MLFLRFVNAYTSNVLAYQRTGRLLALICAHFTTIMDNWAIFHRILPSGFHKPIDGENSSHAM